MDGLPIFALAIAGAVIGMVLLEHKKEYGVFVGIVVGILILSFSISRLEILFRLIELVEAKTHIDGLYIQVMLKMTGIAIGCDLTSDICSQAGNAMIAKQVRIFGKVCIVVVGYPIMEQLVVMLDAFF